MGRLPPDLSYPPIERLGTGFTTPADYRAHFNPRKMPADLAAVRPSREGSVGLDQSLARAPADRRHLISPDEPRQFHSVLDRALRPHEHLEGVEARKPEDSGRTAGLAGFEPATHGPGNRCSIP